MKKKKEKSLVCLRRGFPVYTVRLLFSANINLAGRGDGGVSGPWPQFSLVQLWMLRLLHRSPLYFVSQLQTTNFVRLADNLWAYTNTLGRGTRVIIPFHKSRSHKLQILWNTKSDTNRFIGKPTTRHCAGMSLLLSYIQCGWRVFPSLFSFIF